jgi:Cof subfamily protein (haloacid dehalogenase superfamily)
VGFFFTFQPMNTPLLKDVKLVVTDMDGTLLNPNHEVSTQFIDQFWALKEKGITVVAASGRQHNSIVEKLAAVENELTVIAENGAMTTFHGKETVFTPYPKGHLNKTLALLKKQENMHPVLCTNGSAFISKGQEKFEPILREFYSAFNVIDRLEDCTQEVLKIAIYHFESSEKYIFPLVQDLANEVKIKISGPNWVDLSHPNANKGFALNALQKHLGVSREQTMVFGDYFNDLEMMEQAHFSYAMANAHPEIIKKANYKTGSNSEFGVETVLEKLLKLV